jgi:protocatechuate 3,4-dioxygenase beta subunit
MAYETDLSPRYDSRKSFYGKARTYTDEKGNRVLISYQTKVAEIENGKPKVYGTYSATTLRHIKEFLQQNGYKAESSKQIMADYGVK